MEGVAIVNGVQSQLAEARIPVTDPAFLVGWAVFESLVAVGGIPDNLAAHLDRLQLSCDEARIPLGDRALIEREAHLVARAVGGSSRIRITLTAGGARVIVAQPLDGGRRHRPVTAARGVWREDPYLPGFVKHTSRAGWQVALARSEVDEVLLVDGKGRFVEGTTSGILASVGGELLTHPQDGRILGSTTVQSLIARAEALGIPVRLQAPSASGPWDALYIASVTRHIAPVTLLDGARLPGWDTLGRRLAGLPLR